MSLRGALKGVALSLIYCTVPIKVTPHQHFSMKTNFTKSLENKNVVSANRPPPNYLGSRYLAH